MLRNLVKEGAVAPGTGTTVTLSGAQPGFLGFAAAFGTSQLVYYIITDGAQHEMQAGALTVGSPNTLARGTPVWTSTGGSTRLNFTGSCTVYNVVPASRAAFFNAADVLDTGGRRIAGLPAQGAQTDAADAARMDALAWRHVYSVVYGTPIAGAAIFLPPGYQRFKLLFDDVLPSVSGAVVYARWSSDNMGTVLSGASDYRGVLSVTRSTGVVQVSLLESFQRITIDCSSSAMGEIDFAPRGAKQIMWRANHYDSGGLLTSVEGVGNTAVNTATPTHVFIGAVGANLSQCRFKLMGALL